MEIGDLVRHKHYFEGMCGTIISKANFPRSIGAPKHSKYVWVLWFDGQRSLYLADALEVVNASR